VKDFIITPQNNFINLMDGTRPTVSAATIVWANSVATVITETYASNNEAQYVFNMLVNAITSDNATNVSSDFSTVDYTFYFPFIVNNGQLVPIYVNTTDLQTIKIWDSGLGAWAFFRIVNGEYQITDA
jgi:hypothetical protein